jgi:hypothetical protein
MQFAYATARSLVSEILQGNDRRQENVREHTVSGS